jgi:hypothetical protein
LSGPSEVVARPAQVVALAAARVQDRGWGVREVAADDRGHVVGEALVVAAVEEVPPGRDHLPVVARIFGVPVLGEQQVDVSLPRHVENVPVVAGETGLHAVQGQPADGARQHGVSRVSCVFGWQCLLTFLPVALDDRFQCRLLITTLRARP